MVGYSVVPVKSAQNSMPVQYTDGVLKEHLHTRKYAGKALIVNLLFIIGFILFIVLNF